MRLPRHDAERHREEAAYVVQFGQLPPDARAQQQAHIGNLPIAFLPEPVEDTATGDDGYGEPPGVTPSSPIKAPVAEAVSEPESDMEPLRNLEEIREELKRPAKGGSRPQ